MPNITYKCQNCGIEKTSHRSGKVLAKGKPKFCSLKCRGCTKKFQWETASPEQIREVVKKSFEKNVVKSEGCWGWNGKFDKDGYGILGFKNIKYRLAHRVSWYLKYGSLPNGICAHTCDKKFCSNPQHIFITDVKGNSNDLVQKGLQNKGSKIKLSKINENDARSIKKMIRENVDLEDIASAFKVSKSCIIHIKAGRTWKHVP